MNEGARLLREWVRAEGVSQAAAARKVGVDSSALNRWANGARRPTLPMALRLQDVCGIPLDKWQYTSEPEPSTAA